MHAARDNNLPHYTPSPLTLTTNPNPNPNPKPNCNSNKSQFKQCTLLETSTCFITEIN